MGLFPDLLPGYVPVASPGAFAEYPNLPAAPGKTMPQMFEAAAKGELGALLVVGANPVSSLKVDPAALQNTFVIVQDLFLTETAALADVVFPAASLYEKSGTVTNTFGDMQLVRKAADRAGVKPDFEILVRLAGAMGADIKNSGSLRHSAAPLPISASRAARRPARPTATLSGSKPTASNPNSAPSIPSRSSTKSSVWSPATRSTASIFSQATTCHTEPATPGFVPVAALPRRISSFPRTTTLFTSGTLGHFSPALKQLDEHQAKGTGRNPQPTERSHAAAADSLTC